jgi:thymidylate synthase ThyX
VKISSMVIADSISPAGIRLLTHEVTCHRWILAEINTHRQLSKNYRSSRAVPVAKLIAEVREHPAMPVVWMRNRPGMQATEPMSSNDENAARSQWYRAANETALRAQKLTGIGLHKQWVNRVLEPYLYVHGVVSSTEWANFYARRRAADAQPEFKALADAMWEARKASVPRLLKPGEWHLPYVDPAVDINLLPSAPDHWLVEPGHRCKEDSWFRDQMIKLSVARVARVSITPFDKTRRDIAKDIALHDRLWADNHPSPFEHQATPDDWREPEGVGSGGWNHPKDHGNFVGWIQYRKRLPGECVKDR